MFGFVRSIFYDIESFILFYMNEINSGEGKVQNKNPSKWINDKSKIVNNFMSWYMIDYSKNYKKFFDCVTKFLNNSKDLNSNIVHFLVNIFTENPYLISYNHGDPNKEWNFIRRLTMLYFDISKKLKLKEIDLHNKHEISEKHPDLLEITILENKKHIIFMLLQSIIQIQYRFELLTNNVSSLFSSIGSYGDLTTPIDEKYSFYICLTRKDNSPFYLWFHRFVPKFDFFKAKATNIIYDCKLVCITEDIPPDLLKRLTDNDLSRMTVLVNNIKNSDMLDSIENHVFNNGYSENTKGSDYGEDNDDEHQNSGKYSYSSIRSSETTQDNRLQNRNTISNFLTNTSNENVNIDEDLSGSNLNTPKGLRIQVTTDYQSESGEEI